MELSTGQVQTLTWAEGRAILIKDRFWIKSNQPRAKLYLIWNSQERWFSSVANDGFFSSYLDNALSYVNFSWKDFSLKRTIQN